MPAFFLRRINAVVKALKSINECALSCKLVYYYGHRPDQLSLLSYGVGRSSSGMLIKVKADAFTCRVAGNKNCVIAYGR